jgi:hypothetical protein
MLVQKSIIIQFDWTTITTTDTCPRLLEAFTVFFPGGPAPQTPRCSLRSFVCMVVSWPMWDPPPLPERNIPHALLCYRQEEGIRRKYRQRTKAKEFDRTKPWVWGFQTKRRTKKKLSPARILPALSGKKKNHLCEETQRQAICISPESNRGLVELSRAWQRRILPLNH